MEAVLRKKRPQKAQMQKEEQLNKEVEREGNVTLDNFVVQRARKTRET